MKPTYKKVSGLFLQPKGHDLQKAKLIKAHYLIEDG